jgi:hypothetical protein
MKSCYAEKNKSSTGNPHFTYLAENVDEYQADED